MRKTMNVYNRNARLKAGWINHLVGRTETCTDLKNMRMYVTWSILFALTNCNSSSVADMNRSLRPALGYCHSCSVSSVSTHPDAISNYKERVKIEVFNNTKRLTKGVRCRQDLAAAVFAETPRLKPAVPSAKVCSLVSSSSARSDVVA